MIKNEKYKLNVKRDVDQDGSYGYILNLPAGFRFSDDICHVQGFDTMKELRHFAKTEVIQCDCQDCLLSLSR